MMNKNIKSGQFVVGRAANMNKLADISVQFDEKSSYLVHVEKRAATKKIVIIFKKKWA